MWRLVHIAPGLPEIGLFETLLECQEAISWFGGAVGRFWTILA